MNPPDSWLNAPGHHAWLASEGLRLLAFARAAQVADGFSDLDGQGRLPVDAQANTLNTARMTHCFALAHLQGLPGCGVLVDHGLAALAGPLRDPVYGGWFAGPQAGDGSDGKAAYLHAFVALAASSARVAGRSGADALLADAVQVVEARFWSEEEGVLRESFNRDWCEEEAYRGANSNMHGLEAFLALADALDEPRWLERALRIVERVIHVQAASVGFRVIEHFDRQWNPLLSYNCDHPADGFRPFGITPGHGFEWSRLLLQLEAARLRAGLAAPSWLLEDAQQLFARACEGWNIDGAPGIVYTQDWQRRPVVRQRLHWVHAEASASAAALLKRTGDQRYETWYRCFWDFCETHLIDREQGSWHHELDPSNRPDAQIWAGKPDLYHAYQALLIPVLPLAPGIACALRQAGQGAAR